MCSESDYQTICNNCGRIITDGSAVCPDCGEALYSQSSYNNYSAKGTYSVGAALKEKSKPLLKYFLILVIVGAVVGGVFWAFSAAWKNVEESNPYPTSQTEAAQKFFTALSSGSDEDYQVCYTLIAGQRKAATLIQRHSREAYYIHFDRIRQYLTERIGPDFNAKMQIETMGDLAIVTFDDNIVLNLELNATRGYSDEYRYSIKQVREFPQDVMPGLGAEQRNRDLDRQMQSDDNLGTPLVEIDDARDVLPALANESSSRHLKRLIESYQRMPQLDARHETFDYIIANWPEASQTSRFLSDIARNAEEAPHLRRQAKEFLGL